MLRITILDTPTEQRWVLQGRVIGPWAAELKAAWKKSHSEANGRRRVVDLTEVTFIDTSGERVLAKIMQEEAQFVVAGIYATQVVENLRARCKRHTRHKVLLLFAWLLLLALWPSSANSARRTRGQEVGSVPRGESVRVVGSNVSRSVRRQAPKRE